MPDPVTNLTRVLADPSPVLALAPMQDITDRAFWDLLGRYGGADLYVTEYFRVHTTSTPEKWILAAIEQNPTGRPVIAQLIGNEPAALVRTARFLQERPIAGIDFNLGCPAPVVYRKGAGGGLLRDLARVDRLLGTLREAVHTPLSVKTRLGFDTTDGFDDLLCLLARHHLDLVTVHARTVVETFRSQVRYEYITKAVETLTCPVLANGNVSSAARGLAILRQTGARGLMIGRGAVRNPWIFEQLRDAQSGRTPRLPAGNEVLGYLEALFSAVWMPGFSERSHLQRIKKHLNYVGLGVEPAGEFLHQVRRATTARDLFHICRTFLDHDRPLPLEPFDLALPRSDVMAGPHG